MVDVTSSIKIDKPLVVYIFIYIVYGKKLDSFRPIMQFRRNVGVIG